MAKVMSESDRLAGHMARTGRPLSRRSTMQNVAPGESLDVNVVAWLNSHSDVDRKVAFEAIDTAVPVIEG